MGWAQEQVLAPRKDKTEGSLDRPWGQDFARIMVVLRSLGTSEPPCPGSDGDSHHPPPPSALQVVLRLPQARAAGHGKLPDRGWCWQSLSPALSPCLHGCPAKGCDYLRVTEEYAEAQERHFSISVACSKPQSRSLCPSPPLPTWLPKTPVPRSPTSPPSVGCPGAPAWPGRWTPEAYFQGQNPSRPHSCVIPLLFYRWT